MVFRLCGYCVGLHAFAAFNQSTLEEFHALG